MMKSLYSYLAIALFQLAALSATAQSANLSPEQKLGRDIFKELIEINTTHASGNTTLAAEAMAKRLKEAGFDEKDVAVIGPKPINKNLVVRYRGTGKKQPILFLAHLDVVEARREDWSMDPFKFIEQDGFFYGRGTQDVKDGAAVLVATFIRLKKEGFKPEGDLILALTAGEESSADYNGVEWLLKENRSLIDAAYCINVDAGDPQIKDGKRISRTVQASEKSVLNLKLEVKNPGGHSSLPTKDNAIYTLSQGLTKLAMYDFPVQLNEVTRGYFDKMSLLETGQLSQDMKSVAREPADPLAINRLATSAYYNSMMRTTCVATMVEAGHAVNALPQMARATVNCRVLPGVKQEDVKKTIEEVLADSKIVVSITTEIDSSPASPLMPELMQTIGLVTEKYWPGTMVVPVMEAGATDGKYLRSAGIPTYGVSAIFMDVNDIRAHGKDERLGVKAFYDGLEYEYGLMKALSSSGAKK